MLIGIYTLYLSTLIDNSKHNNYIKYILLLIRTYNVWYKTIIFILFSLGNYGNNYVVYIVVIELF